MSFQGNKVRACAWPKRKMSTSATRIDFCQVPSIPTQPTVLTSGTEQCLGTGEGRQWGEGEGKHRACAGQMGGTASQLQDLLENHIKGLLDPRFQVSKKQI